VSVFHAADEKPPQEEEHREEHWPPIRLDISYPNEVTDAFYRLDYQEIWTIDHNVKVKFLGAIHKQSQSQFKRVFERNQLLVNFGVSHDTCSTFEQNEEHLETQEEKHSSCVQLVASSSMNRARDLPTRAHDALPKHQEPASKLEIDYELTWELLRFLPAYFLANQNLRDVLTLTGNETRAQAISCGQYLSDNFPEISLQLVEVIQNYPCGQENSMLY
jgi:hypothetical protein